MVAADLFLELSAFFLPFFFDFLVVVVVVVVVDDGLGFGDNDVDFFFFFLVPADGDFFPLEDDFISVVPLELNLPVAVVVLYHQPSPYHFQHQ